MLHFPTKICLYEIFFLCRSLEIYALKSLVRDGFSHRRRARKPDIDSDLKLWLAGMPKPYDIRFDESLDTLAV